MKEIIVIELVGGRYLVNGKEWGKTTEVERDYLNAFFKQIKKEELTKENLNLCEN